LDSQTPWRREAHEFAQFKHPESEDVMAERKEFEMSEADHAALLEACRPVPYLVFGGVGPESQQDRANRAWARLGDKMGFAAMTVEPSSKGQRWFTAEVVT
jgi:hypothetical protein